VARYGDRVLRVCRAVVGVDDAEDAWSETFLAALKAYPALPPDANHEAWLVTIAHRKAIDSYRSRSRRAIPVHELPAQHSTLGLPGGGYLHDAGGRGGAGDLDLWSALARLPDKQRYCVAYHYLTGLSYAEVADVVGGTADAARRAAADGIRALRRTYRPAQEGPAR
jgi:DNA-directed RNA polymerase specialized sigma24 family protein